MLKTRMKYLFVSLLVFLLAACASPPAPPTPTPDTAVEVRNQEEPEPADEGDSAAEQDNEGQADLEEEEEIAPVVDAAAIFTARCARCHGADRSGANGPALLPESLTLGADAYQAVIMDGSGPMPSFGDRLSGEEIDALVEYILSDPQ